MKWKAAESAESMQTVIESFVDKGVIIKQPDTVALLANMLYWILRRDLRKRIDILAALCHPFTSLHILSPEEYVATRNAGCTFPEGFGPPASQWETVMFPTWIAKHAPGKGLGGFAGEDILKSQMPSACIVRCSSRCSVASPLTNGSQEGAIYRSIQLHASGLWESFRWHCCRIAEPLV